MGKYIDFDVDRFGNVTLTWDDQSIYLQGDDAAEAIKLEEELSRIWEVDGPHGPFESFEEHLTVCFDGYFDLK